MDGHKSHVLQHCSKCALGNCGYVIQNLHEIGKERSEVKVNVHKCFLYICHENNAFCFFSFVVSGTSFQNPVRDMDNWPIKNPEYCNGAKADAVFKGPVEYQQFI